MNSFKRLLGASLLLVSMFLFITFTGSVNEAQGMGGPISFMLPSPSLWTLIVGIADVLFILMTVAGLKLLNITRRTSWWLSGWLLAIVGAAILILGMINHINAPVLDEIQDDPVKMQVDLGFHIAVYVTVATCWLVCLVFQLKGRKNKQVA
jgi:hypothetical protein